MKATTKPSLDRPISKTFHLNFYDVTDVWQIPLHPTFHIINKMNGHCVVLFDKSTWFKARNLYLFGLLLSIFLYMQVIKDTLSTLNSLLVRVIKVLHSVLPLIILIVRFFYTFCVSKCLKSTQNATVLYNLKNCMHFSESITVGIPTEASEISKRNQLDSSCVRQKSTYIGLTIHRLLTYDRWFQRQSS